MKIPYAPLFLPYFLTFILFLFGPVDYTYPTIKGWFVVFLSITVFVFSYRQGAYFGRTCSLSLANTARLNKITLNWFKKGALLILMSSIAFVAWIRGTGTSLEMVMVSTGDVREITRQTGWDKQLFALFAYQTYAFIPILFTPYRALFSLWVRISYVVAALAMSLAVVLQAGRTFFLAVGILFYVSYFICPYHIRVNIRKSATVRVFIIGFLSVAIPATIYIGTNRVSDKEISMATASTTLRYGDSIVNLMGEGDFYKYVIGFSYIVTPWDNFFKLIEADDTLFRMSTGPLQSIIDRLGIDNTQEDESRERAINRYIGLGGQETGWTTGYGSAVLWYGLLGVTLFSSLVGYYLGKFIALYRRTLDLYHFLAAVWVAYIFVYCLFYFPADSIFYINACIVFLVIPLLSRLQIGK